MLESGLFFTLGFLSAAFFALMIAPAIWRRAVKLTQQKIENSVPLTLSEIQADKDQLRAEFAMSNRRLEVSLEALKERSAEQFIEINRRREEMQVLADREAEKAKQIEALEEQQTQLRSDLKAQDDKLKETKKVLGSTKEKLADRSLAYEDMKAKYQALVDDFDGQKIEMVARETRMDTIYDEARETREQLKKQKSTSANLSSELKNTKASLQKEQQRTQELNAKLDQMQAALADMEGRVERRDADIAKLRGKGDDTETQISELQEELDKASKDKTALKAEVSDTRKRLKALLDDASLGNAETAIAKLESERRNLEKALADAETDRKKLRLKIATLQNSSGDKTNESKDNALVRDRIKELAAQVTAMTAAQEGAGSPINKALAKATPQKAKPRKKAAAAAPQEKSLADRIRALQSMSEKA